MTGQPMNAEITEAMVEAALEAWPTEDDPRYDSEDAFEREVITAIYTAMREVESLSANTLGVPADYGEFSIGSANTVAPDDAGLVEQLWLATKHGDEDHQAWLCEAYTAFFAGNPVPAPRGSGNKEKRIAELEAQAADRLVSKPDGLIERVKRAGDKLLGYATNGRPGLIADAVQEWKEAIAALSLPQAKGDA